MNIVSKTEPLIALMLRSLFRLSIACALLAMVPIFEGRAFAQQQAATQDDPVRATLAQFGSFVQHPKYGEVWAPTATPQGWHPYPPCNWVNSKVGWYYDDKTPWGAIVHHYGRWAHDDQLGWIWIAGGEFSPGWVVWRSDRRWIGWAPMLPDEDMQTISADAFNNGDSWIFQDLPTFERGCTGSSGIAPRAHIAPLLIETTFVTEIEIVDGIVIFVLPPYIGGPVIDIVFNFQPWSPAFFAQVLIDWNFIWNNLNAAGAPCPPSGPAQQAGGGNPAPFGNPPPGGGGQQGGGNPPSGGGGFQTCPDGSLLPANVQCPVKTVATCFNGLLPPSLCQNFPIICGSGQHALGNTCVANVNCTPPNTPTSDGTACVTPDPPTKVGGGCNGPGGGYAGCSNPGNDGGGNTPGLGPCGPMKHQSGTMCVANVTCTPPTTVSASGTACVEPQYDKQGPHPSPSPSVYTTIVAPTCCAIVHPSYGTPIGVIGTPTPRPTVVATGMPTPIATYRPITAATGTPIPMATSSYRPPPREPLPAAMIETSHADIGHAPSRPVEAISHGGGAQNTYAAKPITITNAHPVTAVSNTPVQPYRAAPVAFAHPMPAATFARPATPMMKKP